MKITTIGIDLAKSLLQCKESMSMGKWYYASNSSARTC